jgi:hypothetical protein
LLFFECLQSQHQLSVSCGLHLVHLAVHVRLQLYAPSFQGLPQLVGESFAHGEHGIAAL